MRKTDFFSLRFQNGSFEFIDQTQLPFREQYIVTQSIERIAEAIEKLEIRGAPAIGLAAAYAIVFSQMRGYAPEKFHEAYQRLARTRPTAVNLFWALDEMKNCFSGIPQDSDSFSLLLKHAHKLFNDDVAMCDAIAEHGVTVFDEPKTVLTHCNTGKLAMGGGGTALNVIRAAYEKGLVKHVYADETRPLLQGSRLTAFELTHYSIPFNIITDSMAAHIMKTGDVGLVITGADRIAANGDSANKIGTYGLAVLCKHHGIPFYIAAPSSTIDTKTASEKDIIIEERKPDEVLSIHGARLSNASYPVRNPSFDVTPAELISGIITETGVHRYPYHFK